MKLFDNNQYISTQVFGLLENLIKSGEISRADRLVDVTADLVRYNTLISVARAGTGHLGASLSMLEVVTEIYFRQFNISPQNIDDKERDIFVLSKGHATPSLYAMLAAKGFIGNERLNKLRRWGGLQGHCDISTKGIEVNTGSLGVGLSRAVGFAIAKQRFGMKGKVAVVTGDGELQEGQAWEALLSAATYKLSNFYLIIDKNEVQTDQFVDDILKYNDIAKTLESIGFAVFEGEGKSADKIREAFDVLGAVSGKPKAYIASTNKGQGVSYMEHQNVLKTCESRYIWHDKAPNAQELKIALDEIMGRVNGTLAELDIEIKINDALQKVPCESVESNIEGEKLTPGFTQKLVELARDYPIVAFDADLESDCGLSAFRAKYPDRFFEMGIMEQHMVSVAAAFSRFGYIPVINSYTAFLTSRSNEQIYNLATEGGRAIIVGHMSGIIPATPGKSHQAYRDISCMKNIHGITMYQPLTAEDCSNVLVRIVKGEFSKQVYLRMSMATSAKMLPTPDKNLKFGHGHVVKKGTQAVILGAGPVLIGESLAAAELLENKGVSVEIINHPWLCDFDNDFLNELLARKIPIIVIEDHYVKGGLGESFYAKVAKSGKGPIKTLHLAIQKFTETGFRNEALANFKLDRNSIVNAVRELL